MAVTNFQKSLIVLSAAALTALLYFAPRTTSKTSSHPGPEKKESSVDFNFENFVTETKKQLTPGEVVRLQKFSESKESSAVDSIVSIWDNAKQPGISASYFEEKAHSDNSEKSFINAAYRYFDGFKMAQDSLQRSYFVSKAIENYTKVLELNPKNLDAKTDLGICYAEGTSNPMQGIMMLREVVKENPNHENAQLNLGFLSIKSGQYEKAIDRLNIVFKINPARIDAYIFLGQTYFQMGKKEKAIESFEKFKSLSNDDKMIAEVSAYIAEIKAK